MAEVDKSLLAFLNGLSKRIIFAESGITDEFLKDEVLGGISDQGLPTKEFRFGIDL